MPYLQMISQSGVHQMLPENPISGTQFTTIIHSSCAQCSKIRQKVQFGEVLLIEFQAAILSFFLQKFFKVKTTPTDPEESTLTKNVDFSLCTIFSHSKCTVLWSEGKIVILPRLSCKIFWRIFQCHNNTFDLCIHQKQQ